jgi:hypothetical protein
MSELSSSYFDTSAREAAYNSAVQNAAGSAQQSSAQFNKKIRKYDEQKEKSAERYEAVKDTATTLGILPLEEALRDTISKVSAKAQKKVKDVITDKLSDKLDEAADKVKSVVSNKFGNQSAALSEQQLPENYLQLPKVNASPELVAENLARRKKLAILKSQTKTNFNIDDHISSANNLTDDLGSKTLSTQRKLMATPRHDAVKLGDSVVEDLSPKNFFQNSRGFQPQGELTKKSFQNPYSIMNDKNALEGARDFKQFDTAEARRKAMSVSERKIFKAPESTKSIMPKGDIDQLAPMREMVKAKDTKLKSSLPNLDEEGNLVDYYTPTHQLPPPTAEMLTETPKVEFYSPASKVSPEENLLGKTETSTATEDSLITPIQNTYTQDLKKVGTKSGESLGKSIEGDILKGGERMLETDEETSEFGLVGDAVGALVGLGSIIGGIFHHHHTPAPPKPPPPPPIINPAPALGL